MYKFVIVCHHFQKPKPSSLKDVTLAEAGKYGSLTEFAFFDKVTKRIVHHWSNHMNDIISELARIHWIAAGIVFAFQLSNLGQESLEEPGGVWKLFTMSCIIQPRSSVTYWAGTFSATLFRVSNTKFIKILQYFLDFALNVSIL